jgi:predicted transcriptional regulator
MGRSRAFALGDLERAVLERLWSDGPADVREMHQAVGAPRGITPNTVQSTLERLHRKGMATRCKRGRAYRYGAALSRRDWLSGAIEELLRGVPGAGAETVLSAFVDVVARTSEERLAELERRVRERRRRGRDA